MSAKNDIQPAAIAAGVVVLGGIIFLSHKKKSDCKRLPNVYSEAPPLFLTKRTQEKAVAEAKRKIREYVFSKEQYTAKDIAMSVANSIMDCDWSNLETDRQRSAWSSINKIVQAEIDAYQANPNQWLSNV